MRFLFLLVFIPFSLSAQTELIFSPATLIETENSLQNVLKFPNTRQDIDLIIICSVYVDRFGNFGSPFCFGNAQGTSSYVDAIAEAAENTKIKPAVYEGSETAVTYEFAVNFKKLGDQQEIIIYQNHGYDSDKYGYEYISPQSIRNIGSNASRTRTCDRAFESAAVQLLIDINGIPTEIGFARASEELQNDEDCKQRILSGFESWRFIPAFLNGQPVEAYYVFINS